MGCVLVYRYTKEGNINELRHNSMYGYENKRNSLVYRYTRTAPYYVLFHSQELTRFEVNQLTVLHSQTNYLNLLQFHKHLQFLED